ncbi:hypothetical protein [Variovorax sp.]|uniref:hypothetical protein n=1 Tax=Variovorax sp. TaxID=1871043 RepID=UPI002D3D9768|nr:hypothetical protein [Variovorax sp.]HYP84955.1 hypothetical protein [Variovorax sp.]
MKAVVAALALCVVLLGFKVFSLSEELHTVQRNTAIAVLMAEAADKKIGAFAPYFAPSKDAFANAWVDANSMPAAVFPDEVLAPLRQEIERRRNLPEAQALKKQILN